MSTDGALKAIKDWWVQIVALVGLIAWLATLDARLSHAEDVLPNLTTKVEKLALAVERLAALEEARQK